MTLPEPSPLLLWSFAALGVLVGVMFVAALAYVYRGSTGTVLKGALAAAAWMGLTLGAAATGRLSFAPPTMLALFGAVAALAVYFGRSRLGERLATLLPLAALVGFQSFRILVELLLHRAYVEGLMPVQMSYSGRNFDIASGITAVGVAGALAAGRCPTWLVRAWNFFGMALLANVLVIAVLSAPLPIRLFHNEPANVWVTQAPFVWLPAVMVLAAIVGHILVFRRLRHDAKALP